MMNAPVFWLTLSSLEHEIHPGIGLGETIDLFMSSKL